MATRSKFRKPPAKPEVEATETHDLFLAQGTSDPEATLIVTDPEEVLEEIPSTEEATAEVEEVLEEATEETIDTEAASAGVEEVLEVLPATVVALFHKQRHPVTGAMFHPNKPVELLDLNSPDNAFVRHQIEAKVFGVL
jgi:hypothetical protein